ncbi:hypothetical protein GCM10020255_059170 [Rhodococcus baikonurensis]
MRRSDQRDICSQPISSAGTGARRSEYHFHRSSQFDHTFTHDYSERINNHAGHDNHQHNYTFDNHLVTDYNYGAPDDDRYTDNDNDNGATNHDHPERGSRRRPGDHDRSQRPEALDCQRNGCVRVEFIGR